MVTSRDQEAGVVGRKKMQFFDIRFVVIFGVFEGLNIYHLSSILILNKLRNTQKGVTGGRETITIITSKG